MNNQQPLISRQTILKILLLLIFLATLLYVFTHSLIIVNATGQDSKTIEFLREEEAPASKKLNLTNGTKIALVKRGDYQILVSSKDRTSYYRGPFSGFYHKLSVKTKEQKRVGIIEQNDYDCSAMPIESVFMFYPCNNYSGGFATPAKGGVTSPSAEKFWGSHEEESSESSVSALFRPFGGSFIEVISANKTLTINEIGAAGDPSGKTTSVSQFSGVLDKNKFSSYDDVFSVLDEVGRSLLIFRGANDKTPNKVDLSKRLPSKSDLSYVSIFAGKESIYVLLAPDSSHLDDATSGDSQDQNTEEGRVIVVSVAKKAVTSSHKIPASFSPKKAVVVGSSDLLIMPTDQSEGYLKVSDDRISKLKLPHSNIKDFCATNNKVFYSTTDNASIFEYSPAENASFLVFSGPPESSIESINCAFGQLTFTFTYPTDGVVDENTHYRLLPQAHIGSRAEGLLPLYLDVGDDVLSLSTTPSGYIVELVLDNNKNGGADKTLAKKLVVEKMNNLGINTNNITLDFAY